METVIVGAGIAGLACARRLHQNGRPFVIISSNIGGRILQSVDGTVPLGALYVRADYDHVNQFATRGRRLRGGETLRHDQQGAYTVWDRRLLAHPLQVARFLALLHRFRRHYNKLKAKSEHQSQAEAIRSDRFLEHLYHQTASSTVGEHGFPDIARHYLAPGVHGSTFSRLSEISGFAMLLAALPTIVETCEFTMSWDALLDGLDEAMVTDTVTSVAAAELGFRIETTGGRCWLADNVVVATEPPQAQSLLGLPAVKRPVRAHIFEIDGDLRPRFATAALHLFSDDQPTLAIMQRPDQPALFCTQDPTPDLGQFFDRWQVIEQHDWNPAFNLAGDILLECKQASNLYLIGDHNICGLEDAFITGLYAANQIIARTDGDVGPYQLRRRALTMNMARRKPAPAERRLS